MKLFNFQLITNKRKIILLSTILVLLSLIGILYSIFNTSYKKPINLGMDFIGGNEIRIERVCETKCSDISPDSVINNLREVSKDKSILNKIKLCENFSNFLVTLANNGKLFLLTKIFSEFNNLLDKKNGVVEVTITTTDSIEKTIKTKIESSLEKSLNCKIKLKEIIDESIIGGVIFEVNSIMIDNSIKNKLQDYNFNERLN